MWVSVRAFVWPAAGGEVACLRSLLTCGNNTPIESNAPHSSDNPTMYCSLAQHLCGNSYEMSIVTRQPQAFFLYFFTHFPSLIPLNLPLSLPFCRSPTSLHSQSFSFPAILLPVPLSCIPPLSVFPPLTPPPPIHPNFTSSICLNCPPRSKSL